MVKKLEFRPRNLLSSSTLWGALLAIIGGAAFLVGDYVPGADRDVSNTAGTLLTALGGATAIKGRLSATGRIIGAPKFLSSFLPTWEEAQEMAENLARLQGMGITAFEVEQLRQEVKELRVERDTLQRFISNGGESFQYEDVPQEDTWGTPEQARLLGLGERG